MAEPRSLKAAFAATAVTLVPLYRSLTRVQHAGVENLPKTGFILAANHISYVDPIGVGYMLYRNGFIPHFMAKKELFEAPVLGGALKFIRQIPVDRTGRGSESLEVAQTVLDDGGVVVIYPEGTITQDPDYWPMTFKTGAARLALKTGAPLVPAGQWGVQELLPRDTKMPKPFPRSKNMIAVGQPIDLAPYQDQPITGKVLKEITNTTMAEVKTLVESLRGEKAPEGFYNPVTKTREAGI